MKHLIVSIIALFIAMAAATSILRSHTQVINKVAGTATGSTLQEPQGVRNGDKLPIEDFDDRSLVFPREAQH
jgi:hypothetical protein